MKVASKKGTRFWVVMMGVALLGAATLAHAGDDDTTKRIREIDATISKLKSKPATQCDACARADVGNPCNSQDSSSKENNDAWAVWREIEPFKSQFSAQYKNNEKPTPEQLGKLLDSEIHGGGNVKDMSCAVMYRTLTGADSSKFTVSYADSCKKYLLRPETRSQCTEIDVAELERTKAELLARGDGVKKPGEGSTTADGKGSGGVVTGGDYGDTNNGPSTQGGGSTTADNNCPDGNCNNSKPQRGGVDPTLVNGVLGFFDMMLRYDLGKQQVNTVRMYHRGVENAYQSCLDADMQVGYRTNCWQMMTSYMCNGSPYGCQGGMNYPQGYNPYMFGQYPWQNGNGSNFWSPGGGSNGGGMLGGGGGFWGNISMGGGVCMGGGMGCGMNNGSFMNNGGMWGSNPWGNYNQWGYNGAGMMNGGGMYNGGMYNNGMYNGGMMNGGMYNQGMNTGGGNFSIPGGAFYQTSGY